MQSETQALRKETDRALACVLCGGVLWRYGVGDVEGLAIGECGTCGLVQVAFKDEEERAKWEAYYADTGRYHRERVLDGYESFEDRYGHDLIIARGRVENLIRHCEPKGNLLDIGCSNGAFVAMAEQYGFGARGIDPDSWAVGRALRLTPGRRLQAISLEDYVADRSFDVVTMIDSFEHLTRPHEALEKVHGLLRERELLVLEMPDADCPAFQLQRWSWKHFKPREHAFLYGLSHMKKLLPQHHFVLIDSIVPYPDRRTYYARSLAP